MYFIYGDESGDSGHNILVTRYITFVGIMIEDAAWKTCLNKIKQFRQHLKRSYNINLNVELHASAIWRNKETFKKLNFSMAIRRRIFRDIVLFIRNLQESTILIVSIDKSKQSLLNVNLRELGWKYLLQRYENFLTSEGKFGLFISDKGFEEGQRRLLRKMRVYNPIPSRYGGYYRKEVTKILEDPNIRDSSYSYFVQLADIVAYISRLRDDPTSGHKKWGLHKFYKSLKPRILSQASSQDTYSFVYP